jgi:tetratricopeptide (TPR) repeat protein
MSDNYADETLPLFKLLKTEAFRFIVVRYNHYAMVNRLKEDLQKRFPTRKLLTIDARKTTYTDILQVYYDLGEGFLLVENFEEVLKNPELYAGLNQRRDKLAQYPIAFIALTAFSSSELYTRQIMEKMPDWWSFRSLVLDFVAELSAIRNDNFALRNLQSPILEVSTLGGRTKEEKEKELARLLSVVASTPETETALLRNVYEQIGEIQEDLGAYLEAEKYYLKAEELIASSDNQSLGAILTRLGWIHILQKRNNQAEISLLKAKEIYEEGANTVLKDLALTYNHLGVLYQIQANYSQAKTYYFKAKELYENDNSNHFLKYQAFTYNNLATFYIDRGDILEAMQFYLRAIFLLENGDNVFPNELAVPYSNLGNLYLYQSDYQQAEKCYLKAKELQERDTTTLPQDLAMTYYNLGILYFQWAKYDLAKEYNTLSGEKLNQVKESNRISMGLLEKIQKLKKDLENL